MARRKNASFTLDKTYGPSGDRFLIQKFYVELDHLFPGHTPVPIPPESRVSPTHDLKTNVFIFADFTVRKFAPLVLRAAGFEEHALELEQLPRVKDKQSAAYAARVANAVDVHDDAAEVVFVVSVAAFTMAAADLYDKYAADHARNARAATAGDSSADRPARHAARFAANEANRVSFYTAQVAYHAAKLNPNETWSAVNEMLQQL